MYGHIACCHYTPNQNIQSSITSCPYPPVATALVCVVSQSRTPTLSSSMCLQEMQPAQAEADPAEWAEGQAQASSQAAESHGSAPSATAHAADADTADSAAEAGPAGSPASSSPAGRAGPGDGPPNMQPGSAEHELESSMLSRGREHVPVLCCHVCMCIFGCLALHASCTHLDPGGCHHRSCITVPYVQPETHMHTKMGCLAGHKHGHWGN